MIRFNNRSPREASDRAGSVLLEILVAMTVFGIAATSLVSFVHESVRAVERTHEMERSLRDASAFMDKITLWSRADLDRHLGNRPSGAWRLTIQRPRPSLYEVTLFDSTGTRVLLHTVQFRAEEVARN